MDFLSERPKSRLDAFRGSEGRKDLAEPPLASEGSSWPGEKESSVLSSPSCLERKGAWQNPAENEAKVQVATEKQPEFMKEAQGMEADGTRLFGKTRELGTRGSTGAPPEGSHCSGVEAVTAKAAVSGTDSLVSLEPVSQEEEERCNGPSASPRQAGEETLPKENEERNTVFDNTSSILLDNCRLALPLERRSNVDTSSSSSGFEASKRSSKLGHRPRDVPEVNSRVQKEFHLRKEETLKSNWSFGEEGDFEALSQTGKTEVKLLVSDSKEQKVSDALDHSFNFVHKGTVEIQKGQALHSCWEEGDDFHLECGRLQAPAEQLTVSVNVPSEIGVGDVALFEKPLEGFSGADSIPKDTFHFLGRGRLTVMAIENWTLSLKGNDFLCFQDNCASPHSLNHSSLQVGSRGLARGVRGSRYFRGVDTGALADQESLQMRHLSDEFLFPLQADPRLSLRGSTDFLPPSKVSAMLCLARLLRPRKAFASSPKRGSCAAEEEEGWERARGEKPNTEPSGSKMPRPRNSNPWQKHKETTGGVSPTGPALVLGEVPRSKGSALTGSSLKAGTLKGPRASVPLEWAFPSDLLKPGYSGHGPALGAKGDGLHSADELVAKSPPEKFSFKNRLFYISSSPHQTFLQPGPPSLESPERTEQIFVKFREGREIPNLTCAGCSSRRAPKEKICSSQKRGALILPSLKAFSSSLARERFLAQGTNRHWSLFALSVENASTPLRQDVLRSNDSEQNLGEAQEQSGLTDDETELPFPVSAFSKEALETLLESRKVTFSFQDAICTPLPSICLFKDVLEIDCGKAKDSSELTVLKWPTENVSYALKTKHLFCRRAAAEIVGGSIMFCFLKGETLETFFSGTESHLLEVESRQGWAGGQKKPLEGHLVGHGIQVPFEEGRVADLGAQLSLPKEAERKSAAPCDLWRPEWGVRVKPKGRSPLKRRCFGNGQPLGCVSQGSAASREDPQPRPFAPVGHVVQNREEESPLHAVREFKRPKRDKRGGVCFRKQSQRANRQNATVVAALWALPGGEGCPQMESPGVFAHSCRAGRLLPPLWQESVRACIQAVLNQFRASEIRSGSPFLGNLVHRDSATKPAAPQKLKTLPWDRPTKRQGGQSRLWGSLWPRPHAHEVCLRTLSALADKLLAPVGTPQKCKPLSCSSEPLPSAEKCSRGRSKKVLEIISFASLKFSFNPRLPRGRRSVKMAASQAPTESRILCCFQLTPSAFSSLVFPGSVHLGMDARKPQDPTPQLALGDPPPLQTSRRRLSSCLSSSCSNVQGGTGGPAELWATFACEGGGAVAQNPGCPARGLRTALAAFPHGCHQLWTRRRSLARRISTVPKVTLLQFARGLKGLKRAPGVSAEFFSSLRCSLGRALSIRNQQGAPPAGPSECPPLHPNPCQGQPASPASASLGHGNSSTEPPLVPDLPSDPPWVGNKDALRQEPSCLDPAQPPLGLPAPGLGDEPEASHLPGAETPLEKVDSEKRPKKVSQIRIRKTIPKPDPNLTPMGLPRQKRLKKTEFSLEEIYTNKNYKSPPPTRCLETIFEEPKEKNGSLISVSQQKRKRILEFPDFTVPRKRKARSRAKGASGSTRAQKAAVGGRELDLLLVQKLTDLESFFAKEEKQEPTLGR